MRFKHKFQSKLSNVYLVCQTVLSLKFGNVSEPFLLDRDPRLKVIGASQSGIRALDDEFDHLLRLRGESIGQPPTPPPPVLVRAG